MENQTHDVAISFLVKDEPIARALHDGLVSNLKVFFFPHNQEELAGTDGLETMRAPFLGARVIVVLFNNNWGETPWTRVEATAIKESCLERGWEHLFFVNLGATEFPVWLPKTHVRLNYTEYGLIQAIGAIKARAEDLGGELKKPDALSQGRLVKRQQEYLSKKNSFFNSHDWISNNVHKSIQLINLRIAELCKSLKEESGFPMEWGAENLQLTVNCNGVSLVMRWAQQYTNVLDTAQLSAEIYKSNMALPGQHLHYWPGEEPQRIQKNIFKADLNENLNLVWILNNQTKQFLNEENVAQESVSLFLEKINAVNLERSKRHQH